MVPLDRFGFAPIMKMAIKLMRMTMIATTLKYEDDLDVVDDADDVDDVDDADDVDDVDDVTARDAVSELELTLISAELFLTAEWQGGQK